MIAKHPFGRTGHDSTRIVFGGYALSKATQAEANQVLDTLLGYGVNHIDTAPMYGKSEERIGPWMEQYRSEFFLATKSRKRSYEGAWEDLERSLERLQVDQIDLWQMHGLTNPVGWEKVMGPSGALEAFIEAREKGLVRFLGVTGHGDKVPEMHLQSLERFDFDSVLLPHNYILMQKARYAADFNALMKMCKERSVAFQTIKSIVKRPWGAQTPTHNTYFYEPLTDQRAIDMSVHWALGLEDSFVITAGDMQVLPKILDAANRFLKPPSDSEMKSLIDEFEIQSAAFTMSDLK